MLVKLSTMSRSPRSSYLRSPHGMKCAVATASQRAFAEASYIFPVHDYHLIDLLQFPVDLMPFSGLPIAITISLHVSDLALI